MNCCLSNSARRATGQFRVSLVYDFLLQLPCASPSYRHCYCCQPNARPRMTCDLVIVRQGQAKSPGAQVRPRGCNLAPCSAAALLWLDAIAEPSPQFGEAACVRALRPLRQSDASSLDQIGSEYSYVFRMNKQCSRWDCIERIRTQHG